MALLHNRTREKIHAVKDRVIGDGSTESRGTDETTEDNDKTIE